MAFYLSSSSLSFAELASNTKEEERHELGRLSLEGMKDSLNNSRREGSSLWLFLTELGETQIAAS